MESREVSRGMRGLVGHLQELEGRLERWEALKDIMYSRLCFGKISSLAVTEIEKYVGKIILGKKILPAPCCVESVMVDLILYSRKTQQDQPLGPCSTQGVLLLSV